MVKIRRPKMQLPSWGGFVHLLARYYMDYWAALDSAARRKRNRAIDIDVQISKDGVLWALHWHTLGLNKLHDPWKKHGPDTLIKNLTDSEIRRMRGPKGQQPHRVESLLMRAEKYRVRVELELKVPWPEHIAKAFMQKSYVKYLDSHGLLQFKTLAAMKNAHLRLAPIHAAGGTTILSFTDYKGPGLSRKVYWPITDYVRGKPQWVD